MNHGSLAQKGSPATDIDDANFKAHFNGADDYNAGVPRINHQ